MLTLSADLPSASLASTAVDRMGHGAKVSVALDGDLGPSLACGWLLSGDAGICARASWAVRPPFGRPLSNNPAYWNARCAATICLVAECPVRLWNSIGSEWRLTGLLNHTPGAMLFSL
ncbi:hypothetical protein JHL17_35720 [Azospirillum sp. YIM B02556]|uniref:Uncharacterized protein n=1 Tax=Azospirillum endophyticum TaxID=2800326 RepID=A0ABS1FH47_9PROT|nr:hypothetical protein [Azospirillum endophyticum]MBK1842756.1 hypothetical protein [Azospirillum endophyticum]